MSDSDLQTVWVFHGEDADFASGVFTSRERAEAWIQSNKLSGTLTKYPVDIPAYEWAMSAGLFTPTRDDHRTPAFIGRFSSATQEYDHDDEGAHGGEADAASDD